MSVLAEQHQAWATARKRLVGNTQAPEPKPEPRPRPQSPFKRERMEHARKVLDRRPDLAIVFPTLKASIEAGFPPASIIAPVSTEPPKWWLIADEVARKHGLTINDLRSHRRDAPSTKARHEAFFRLRNETTYSLPQIGGYFGGRDHTTVIHGIKAHKLRMKEQVAVETIEERCARFQRKGLTLSEIAHMVRLPLSEVTRILYTEAVR